MNGTIRLLAAVLAVLAGAAAPAAPVTKPRHIMTMDMCDDLLMLMLVPRQRIASVTYLAGPAVDVLMPGADRGVAINHGTAEEILRQRPDLIVASPFSTPAARRLAKRVGARLIEVDVANSFADIRDRVRQVAAAVGESARGEALIVGMDATLARLVATRPARPLRVVAWEAGGSVPGRGTLTDAIITAAGAANLAARREDASYSSFNLEELLAARPQAVLQGVGSYGQPSLHNGVARHPLIDRLFAGRQVDYPSAAYTCGLPQSADAAAALRAQLGRVVPGTVRW